jgi:predicted ester cyclase
VNAEHNKAVVRRLVTDVFERGDLELLEQLYQPALAGQARAWIAPFLASFSDLDMEIVDLIGENDKVAALFLCSGTHSGEWLGHPPTGRRFHRVAEVYFFQFTDGRISNAWGLEDTFRRLRQLGLI